MTPHPLMVVAAGLLGLVMGSAVTAIAYRVPRGISWVHGRSACPRCGHVLTVPDLVPVFSWLLARGRCRHCGEPISWRYPLTEAACAAWAVLLLFKVGLGIAYPLLAAWGFMMIALFWIDLDFQLLPDVLTFPGTWIGLAAALTLPQGARHALWGVVLGSGLLWLLAWGYLRVRKIEGMGGGDVKLAAMFGTVLGWELTLMTLFLSAVAGSIWGIILMARKQGGGQTPIPFGSLLAPVSLVCFLWGDAWFQRYMAMFRGH